MKHLILISSLLTISSQSFAYDLVNCRNASDGTPSSYVFNTNFLPYNQVTMKITNGSTSYHAVGTSDENTSWTKGYSTEISGSLNLTDDSTRKTIKVYYNLLTRKKELGNNTSARIQTFQGPLSLDLICQEFEN